MTDSPKKKPTGDVLRPLGDLEYTYWFMDLASSTNFVVMAAIDGAITEVKLKKALEDVQSRYPLLNVGVERNVDRQTVFKWTSSPIPVRMQQVHDAPVNGLLCDGPLIDHLNREQHDSMNMAAGPLMRCLLLDHGNDRRTLMLTFQHAIADARSAMHVLYDVLSTMDGKPLSSPVSQAFPEDIPPLEHCIPERHAGAVAGLRAAVYSTVQGVHRMFMRPVSVPVNPCWPDQRADRFLLGRFEKVEAGNLSAMAGREGCGIHSAMCAAQLLSLLEEYSDRKTIRAYLLTLVDLRNRGTKPAPVERLSLMISMVEHCQKVKRGTSVWELAREIKSKVAQRLDQGFHFYYLPVQARLIHRLDPLLAATESNSRRLLRTGHLSRPMAMPVSNIGRVEYSGEFRTFTVRDMTFTVPLSSSGIWGSAANTFDGHLNWNFSHASPAIPKEQAVRMAMRSMEILREGFR